MVTRADLASRFETGDIPTADDFLGVLASALLPLDDTAAALAVDEPTQALWADFYEGLPADGAGRLLLLGLLNALVTTFFDFATAGFVFRGVWRTGTSYVDGDCVIRAGQLYALADAHTSGAWATDDAAGRWEPLIRFVGTPTAPHAYIRRTASNERWETRTAGEIVTESGHEAAADPHPQYVLSAGDALTGPLLLAGDPSAALEPVTLQMLQALQAQRARRYFFATGCI